MSHLVPATTSVRVTSDQANPLAARPIGSAVTLTCTVELSPSVDVPVTVNTVWTGPDNFNRNIMAQQMGSTTTYTSTAMVSSFGRDQSGNYTCTATVSSTSQFIMNSMASSPPTRVTVGKECMSCNSLLSLYCVIDSMYTQMSISLWMEQSVLTTVISWFLRLEIPLTTYFSVSLTGCHVVLPQTQQEIGSSQVMEEGFHHYMELPHLAEAEEVMEQSTCTVSAMT